MDYTLLMKKHLPFYEVSGNYKDVDAKSLTTNLILQSLKNV